MRVPNRFEPYVQLVDVTADAALIAWGGFYLDDRDGTWRAKRADETLGARSEPFGRAAVEVVDPDGEIVAHAVTNEANHVWVQGLKPATTYRYRVLVHGEPWAMGPRYGGMTGRQRPWDPPGRSGPTAAHPRRSR